MLFQLMIDCKNPSMVIGSASNGYAKTEMLPGETQFDYEARTRSYKYSTIWSN
jgi:hypothetical protein